MMCQHENVDGIYGRRNEVDALARSRAPVTVLAGDSGTGKSSVLVAAQAAQPQALAPPPRSVPYTGVLQQALLQSLADAVALNVERVGRADQAAKHLHDAALRLARDRGHELAHVVGRELLAVVRSRLGPEFGKAFGDYLQKLRESVDEGLTARLSAALDPGVAGLVIGFAEDVAEAAGCEVLLALDAGERLSHQGTCLLADVAGELPEAVRFRIAIADYTDDQQRELAFLTTVDEVAVQRLGGLTVPEVAEWLEAASLDPTVAESVQRVTGGYALHVGDLVRHLELGGEIENAPLSQQFADRTRESWGALDVEVASCARRLSVFRDPLSRDATVGFLGLDDARWGAVEDALWHARILSVEVNGRRWFHEQRRRFVYESILDNEERDGAASAATLALYAIINQSGRLDRGPELAAIAADAKRLQAEDEQLAGILAMDRDEVALAAALVELIESPSSPAVLADVLLRYARSVFGAQGDLVDALGRIGQRGSVVVVERDDVAAVVPYWRSGLVVAVAAGRAGAELGRVPIPRAASALWEVELRPRVEPFDGAQYGLGNVSRGGLAELALELRSPRESGILVAGRPEPGANLLIRGDYGGRPLYAAVTFKSAAERDAAADRLEHVAGELFGQRFAIRDVVEHPKAVVPARRLICAAERATGVNLGQPTTWATPTLRLKDGLRPEERLRRKAAALNFARARLHLDEQFAAHVEDPIAYAYHADGDLFFELEIIGGRTGAHAIARPAELNFRDPFATFRMAQSADLRPHEHVGHYRLHLGHAIEMTDPVIEVFALLQQRAAAYNASQERLVLPLQEQELGSLLAAAVKRTYADAVALADAVEVGEATHTIAPRVRYATILLEPPEPGVVPGGFSMMRVLECASPNNEEQLHLRIVEHALVQRPGDMPASTQERGTAELFGLECEPEPLRERIGVIHSEVAEILGHLERDIAFQFAGSRPAATHPDGRDGATSSRARRD